MLTRRHFLIHSSAALSLGFMGLRAWAQDAASAATSDARPGIGYGPLVKVPDKSLELPEGFRAHMFSRGGQRMDDGLHVPYQPDGMAAFPGPDGLTILVRNHELEHPRNRGAFKVDNRLLDTIDTSRVYDMGHDRNPAYGGTTTLYYDTRAGKLRREFMSLAGTVRNCAGGTTPWGSWISCEEPDFEPDDYYAEDHGYCFEVPSLAQGLVDPVPLKAMGRFRHEAIVVHPPSGIVYLTEDREDGLLYRFLPKQPGKLAAGGKLQALVARHKASLDTRNWKESGVIPVDSPLPVRWMDMADVDTPADDLRRRGFAQGAARFARGEGMWFDGEQIYFACTNGGRKRLGQIWRYRPSPAEGTPDEERNPGSVELFIEPNDGNLVQNADNLTGSPWGDLIICEDHGVGSRLVGVTPQGEIYHLARTSSRTEFAGATFSPDGSTLFFNIMSGFTYAVTGPWRTA